jgi:hypothetical protein
MWNSLLPYLSSSLKAKKMRIEKKHMRKLAKKFEKLITINYENSYLEQLHLANTTRLAFERKPNSRS